MAHAAGVRDGREALVEALGCGGQITCRLRLDDHRRHMVGHDVVEFTGDAGALGGTGVLRDAAATLGLGGPAFAEPCPDAPGECHGQVEHHVLAGRLARSDLVERDDERNVRRGEGEGGGAPVVFELGRHADQGDGQRGARECVVAAELVEGEADRDQGETDDRPPLAPGQREALEGDGDDGQGVEGAVRQVPDHGAVILHGKQERSGEDQQRERPVPERGA